MLIYKDILSGDEICSDAYPMKLVDDLVFEFDVKRIQITNAIDDNLIGGNASAEEAGDGTNDDVVSKVNIIHTHNLQETTFTKASYQTYIKGYMKSILARLEKSNPERAAQFKSKVPLYLKNEILGKFDQYQFFTGEKMNPEAMVILMNYREDGLTPYFVMFKDGIEEEKC